MRRAPWLVIALTPALMATSCPLFIRVHVEPGPASATTPEFRFTVRGNPLRQVDSLAVFACPERTLHGGAYDTAVSRLPVWWRVVRDPAAAPGAEPLRITYGRVPPGYREASPAAPIQPGGCYHARAVMRADSTLPRTAAAARGYGIPITGTRPFRLLPHGRLIAGEPTSPLLDSRAIREINRAAVGCARGYRRARTPADSAAVDARAYGVLDTPLSCGWLRAHWPDVMDRSQTTERTLLVALGLAVSLVALLSEGSD